MKYLDIVNDPHFREANRLTHKAQELLMKMGYTKRQAYDWICSWASGAGDGIE